MKSLLAKLARIRMLVFAAGLGTALLARYSPGATVDARKLDRRLGEDNFVRRDMTTPGGSSKRSPASIRRSIRFLLAVDS